MRIGILTFHNAINFGAVLQAYALQSFLTDLGHDVEMIDYRNDEVERSYRQFKLRYMPKRSIIKFYKYWVNNCYRHFKFNAFRQKARELLNVSDQVKTSYSPLNKYDVIIIGSDQLWNKKITRDLDRYYFAEFRDACHAKVITYAVCMNTDAVTADTSDFVKEHLRCFDAISVRETSLKDYLQTMTNREISVDLDPTLLMDESFWQSRLKSVPFDGRYVCVYPILEYDEVIKYAKDFAKSKGLPLVILEPIAGATPLNDHYRPSDQLDFISTIANADYVITSSFHGLAFSLIFRRDVIVFGSEGKNERMKSLLDIVGMSDRFYTLKSLPGELAPIDYVKVGERLSERRELSRRYLLDNLKPQIDTDFHG